ncbi:hypothetical protein ONZ45_g4609 [Pleurotus djamor]|nr:hypothetical protein ONZ45_g4609 [Pleurotus djamor]
MPHQNPSLWVLATTLLALFSTSVLAAPLDARGPTSKATPTPLISSDLDAFVRPAQFSRAVYCSTASVTAWTCGKACDDIGGIEVLKTGGDDGLTPLFLVAHDPSTESLVVAHQGTNPENFLSILNDVQILLVDLDETRFASVKGHTSLEGIKVHDGFQKTFERTADDVLSAVKSGLESTNVTKISVTGHSLGAAIATMDAMMFKELLPSSIEITTTVFGLPRGGNEKWANLVDSSLGSSFVHITNQNDIVPTVPPQKLGYQHPQGEVHIKKVDASGNAVDVVACPGQENKNCLGGDSILRTIKVGFGLSTAIENHSGPYLDNISFGSAECTD